MGRRWWSCLVAGALLLSAASALSASAEEPRESGESAIQDAAKPNDTNGTTVTKEELAARMKTVREAKRAIEILLHDGAGRYERVGFIRRLPRPVPGYYLLSDEEAEKLLDVLTESGFLARARVFDLANPQYPRRTISIRVHAPDGFFEAEVGWDDSTIQLLEKMRTAIKDETPAAKAMDGVLARARITMSSLKAALETTCGGKWKLSEAETVLVGTCDLPPDSNGPRHVKFAVFRWDGDGNGVKKALEDVSDWKRPMKVIWQREWTVLVDDFGNVEMQDKAKPFIDAVLSVIKRHLQEKLDSVEMAVKHISKRAEAGDVVFFRRHMKDASTDVAKLMVAQVKRANLVETYEANSRVRDTMCRVSYHDLTKGLTFAFWLEDTGQGWIIGEFSMLR